MTANTGACQQHVVKLTELPVIYFADMVLMANINDAKLTLKLTLPLILRFLSSSHC
jgi:hypothetical protein